MMLLTWMPVPGTTMPEPSPFVHVTEQARPSASMTVRCVVEPIREPSSRAREAGLAEPLDELRRARRLRLLHRAHDERERRRRRRSGRAAAATARAGSRRRTAAGWSARRARGSGPPAARARSPRSARRSSAVSTPPPAPTQSTTAAAMSPVVERRRALGAEPLDRVAELGLAQQVAFAQQRPVGRVERPRPRASSAGSPRAGARPRPAGR